MIRTFIVKAEIQPIKNNNKYTYSTKKVIHAMTKEDAEKIFIENFDAETIDNIVKIETKESNYKIGVVE